MAPASPPAKMIARSMARPDVVPSLADEPLSPAEGAVATASKSALFDRMFGRKEGKDAESANLDYSMDGANAVELRKAVRSYFRALGPTKEWAENNYYKLPIAQQDASLIPINAFWSDFAAWDGNAPFLSAHVAEASRNFSEMMLALAVLDLPFEAAKHTTRREGASFTLTAGSPLIVFHTQIKPGQAAEKNDGLLVSQNFYRNGDRYREEGEEKFDKWVSEEFLTGVVYGANLSLIHI